MAGNAIEDAKAPLCMGLPGCCSHGSCGGPCLHCHPTRSQGIGKPDWSPAWLNSRRLRCQGWCVGLGCKQTGQGFRRGGGGFLGSME